MSAQASLAVLTGLLGLITASVVALVSGSVKSRADVDEGLRAQRLVVYRTLWKSTAAVPRWPRISLTRGGLSTLHRTLRDWYYDEGGLFLSEASRARHGDVQELIAAMLAPGGDGADGADGADGEPTDVATAETYTDLMETVSALRTALAQDLDTRRRKSILEASRRTRWHAKAGRDAKARIARAADRSPDRPPLFDAVNGAGE
jgi:hypothetical protein